MDITNIIFSQRECLTKELHSGTFKSSGGHWFYRTTDPDEQGDCFVRVFDVDNNRVMPITVRKVYSVLYGHFYEMDSSVVMRATCPHKDCVNPSHNTVVFALTDKSFDQGDSDDWSIPFGWQL